ncbi:MAG TPA: hypothetical protein VI455_05780 [Terriglobia bacterium]
MNQTPLTTNGDMLTVSSGGLARLPIGTANQCLQVNGAATGYQFGSCAAGAAPGGASAQIQFNNSGVFGGAMNFTYNTASGAVSLQPAPSQDAVALSLAPSASTPTNDTFDVFKDSGKTTKTLWVDSSGNLNLGGEVATTASAASGAGFNMPSGTAPTSPVSGDFWQESGVPALYNGAATLAGVVNPEPATYNPSSTSGIECRVDGIIFSSYTQCFTAVPDGATLRIIDYMGAADPLSDPLAVNKGHQHWHIMYLAPGQPVAGTPLPIPVNNAIHTGINGDPSGAGNAVSCMDPDVGPAGGNPWCVFQASSTFPPAVNPPAGPVSASAVSGGTLSAQTDNIWLAYLTASGPTEILVQPPGWTPSHKYGVGYPIMDTSTNCGGGPCTWVALTAGFSGASYPAFNSNGTLGAKVSGDGGTPAITWMNIAVGASFYQTPAAVSLDGVAATQINVAIPGIGAPIANTAVYLTQTAAVAGTSESANTATLTSAANLTPNVVVDANVYVQGVGGANCAGYNGVWTITAITTTSLSFWTPTTGLPNTCTVTSATYEIVSNEAPSGLTPTASTYQGVKGQSTNPSMYSIGCSPGCSQATILSTGNSPVEVNATQSVFVLGPPNPGKRAGGIEISGRISNLTVDAAAATAPWNVFTGNVGVTNGSPTVTWKDGNQFQSGNLWTLSSICLHQRLRPQ